MKILYFASMRDKLGFSNESIACPIGVSTVGDLVEHLRGCGSGYELIFSEMSLVSVAVNYEYSDLSRVLSDSDEVAFFPPVTGG